MNSLVLNNKRRKIKDEGCLSKGKDDPHSRIYALFFLICGIAGIIILRLFSLQVSSYDYYKNLADNQHSVLKNLFPSRGEIFLKEGNDLYPVAVNKDAKMAYAIPREIQDPFETAGKLSEILGLDEGDLRERLNRPDDMYEVLKRRLSDEEILKIKELKLDGVRLSDENFRYYPAGELASQVLGFVGWKENDLGGRYGIENYFDSELSGNPGKLFQNKDNSGLWVSTKTKDIAHAEDGDNLILTIDHIIQYETEKILRNAIGKFDAEKGAIVVMDPSTGHVLAMASYPNFNPNNYKETPMENFRNLAVSEPYECGSVFKPITMASAIDAGKVNKNTTYTDTGQVLEAGYKIKNSDLKSYGVQTMTQVLERSLNTGVIYAEKLLGNENFRDYVERFGFGARTGIDLTGESAGNISNLDNPRRTINFFTASFGQGITVTPIQLVSAFNAIANGGTLMKPQIVEKIIHGDGSEERISPKEVRKVISKSAADQVSEMLRNVVVNGHGKLADVPGYLVGGKTGTAQVASRDSKGYDEDKHIGSFVGFAPINNPQFTAVVRIDNPKNVEWAESSAAPVFGELAKFILNYKNIKPTEGYTQEDLDRFDKTHTISEYVIKEEDEEENEKEEGSGETGGE